MSVEPQLRILRKCTLFEDFSDQAIVALMPFLQELAGGPGDRLFTEGEPGESLYIIMTGTVGFLSRDAQGNEHRIGLAEPGASFGELSLLLRGTRMVTVEALGPVSVAELSGDAFRQLKRDHPDVCLLLIMGIVKKFGKAVDSSRDVLKHILQKNLTGLER